MSTLHIRLLGNFRLVYNQDPVTTITQARLQALLAYLLLYRKTPQSRQQLAFLFWPDTSERQARTNLRRELYHLRRLLPDAEQYVQSDIHSVQWCVDAPYTLDVADFEELIEQAGQAEGSAEAEKALIAAIEIYHGRLLPGCYEDWVLPIRERLERRFAGALEKMMLLLEERQDYPAAIRYGQRLLRHDPLYENTHRRLMRLHARNGDRSSALRVYHSCMTVLQRELGVGPDQETQEAYACLLNLDMPRVLRTFVPLSLRTVTNLVGRQSEWQQLQAIWHKVPQGRAHFVLIAGEAGIGKTRLAEELLESIGQTFVVAARARSYAAEGELAYAPVIEWLRTEAFQSPLNKLDDVWLTEVARLLPELLVSRPDLPHPEPLSERWQRQRLFEALARATLVDDRPRLLLLDDLQWCDPETLAWLRYLFHYDPRARLLIVGTARPEEIGPEHPLMALVIALRNSEQVTEIELGPLDADDTATLATQMAGQKLDPARTEQLYQVTEGNPLFIVETVRAEVNKGTVGHQNRETLLQTKHPLALLHPGQPSPMPPKVQAVIQSRLARLSPWGRELAGIAATIGRSFTFDVLAQASDGDEETLVRGLDELWQRRIVREQGADAYDFSHDRIREAAYAEINQARRHLFHRRVAEALESVHATTLDRVSGQIAAHFERAGLLAQAIPYYQRAGEVAQRVCANQDAILQFRRGLTLLKTLPASRKRDRQELALQISLGVPLAATKGTAAQEVQGVYLQAWQLCQQLGHSPNMPILRGLASVYAVRGELHQSLELLLELMALAQNTQKTEHLVEAHYALGMNCAWMGDFVTARQHLEQAIAHYDPKRHQVHAARYAQDPGVICRIWLALVLWFLGYPTQALQWGDESLALACELAHPLSHVYALMWYGKLHEYLRNPSVTLTCAEQTIALATEHGFPLWASQGMVHRGWALSELGKPAEGVAQIQAGMTAHEQTGARIPRPWHLALLATAYGKLGKVKEALAALDEALAFASKTGIHDCDAERWRLKGELTFQLETSILKSTLQSQAEDYFLKAINVARSQQARSLELCAVMSLSRLWQTQGKQAEAHQMLAETYGWFTEGFDTPDLQAARALLDELS